MSFIGNARPVGGVRDTLGGCVGRTRDGKISTNRRRILASTAAAEFMPHTANQVTPTPKGTFEDVLKELRLSIVLGRMRPRERLVEDELMAKFGAKRHVVRAALSELERWGLIERQQNKGARVREYSLKEVADLYDFRSDLHCLAVARMPLPFPAGLVERLSRIADQHEKAIADSDFASVIDQNNAFHDLLFEQCGNPFLVEAISRMATATDAIRSYRIGTPELLEQAAREHREMIQAGASGDREALVSLCSRHILPSRNLYLRDHALL